MATERVPKNASEPARMEIVELQSYRLVVTCLHFIKYYNTKCRNYIQRTEVVGVGTSPY